MKKIILIFLLLVTLNGYSQCKVGLETKHRFNKFINEFVNSINNDTEIKKTDKRIFMAYIKSYNDSSFIFTMTYFANSIELNYYRPGFIYYLSDNIILARYNDSIDKAAISFLFKPINENDTISIKRKLIDNSIPMNFQIGTYKSCVYYFKNCKSKSVCYDSVDVVPNEFTVFDLKYINHYNDSIQNINNNKKQ